MYMEDLKYFIERNDTNEWFTVIRAYDNKFWTKNPLEARAFNSMESASKMIGQPFRYDEIKPFEGLELNITNHMFVDGEIKTETKPVEYTDGEKLNADIRNKLSSLHNLVAMVENGDIPRDFLLGQLPACRLAIQYLSEIGLPQIEEEVKREYEVFIEGDSNTPFDEDQWLEIDTTTIKHPERIEEYIKNGRLRRISKSNG